MPSKSRKQHNTMMIAAKDKRYADFVGIPQSVAQEFIDADKAAGKYQKKPGKRKGRSSGER